jgi:transformation/transcription domain-associated protein
LDVHTQTLLQAGLNARAHDIKLMFNTWRDRQPNMWDEISVWNDVMQWRQCVFQSINTVWPRLASRLPPYMLFYDKQD